MNIEASNSADFLQRAWATPEKYEIFRDEEFGILVVPNIKPIVPGGADVLVVAKQPSWADMSPLDTARFYVAGETVCSQMEEAFQPKLGVALSRFGRQSPTPHLLCYTRNSPSDGELVFAKGRSKGTDKQLSATQRILGAQFDKSDFAAELRRLLGGITLST